MATPREDAIIDVVNITSLQRGEAIRWLKAYNNDTNKAVDAFFENPNSIFDQQSQVKFDEQQSQTKWDECQFHPDMTNASQQGQNYVGINPVDTLRPGVFSDSAPSRPPSRVSTRAGAAVRGANQSLGMESEDEQVKRAMANSMGDSQTLSRQENGVLEHKMFGPATREHYVTEQWAMTVAGPQTQEIFLNPEPADRKRPLGAPAFFKPSPAGYYLPSLIKILHTIPMAREALLNRDLTLPDYGYQKDWWDGNAIQFLRIVNLDIEGRPINNDDVIYETQRLIAFLDETERAYASTDVLAKTLEVVGNSGNDLTTAFFEKWHEATTRSVPNTPLVDIFTSKGIKVSTESPQSLEFNHLSTRIDDEISGKGLNLYDALDHILWGDNKDGEQTFFEKVGDVFTFEVSNLVANSVGLGIEIPATWYADRYLPSSAKQVETMLSLKAEVQADLDAKEKAQLGLKRYTSPVDGVNRNAALLLSEAIQHFERTAAYQDATSKSSKVTSTEQYSSRSVDPHQLAQELKTLSGNVSQKLKALEEMCENARERLKEVSKLYTEHSDKPGDPPYHKYTLRGVTTTSHTLYVLEKTKPGYGVDLSSKDAIDWQWWRIEYVGNDAKPVRYDKVVEDDVLKAASTESANAMLVYASEAAVLYQSNDLPPQLRNFVRADNLTFSTELEGSACQQPAAPIKRKAEDQDSSDSLHGHDQRSPPYDRTPMDSAMAVELEGPPMYNKSGSFDDVVPTSLRDNLDTSDRRSFLPNQSGLNKVREMQERGSGQDLLRQRRGSKDQVSPRGYETQVDMEDDE